MNCRSATVPRVIRLGSTDVQHGEFPGKFLAGRNWRAPGDGSHAARGRLKRHSPRGEDDVLPLQSRNQHGVRVASNETLTEGPTLFAPARHPVLNLDVNEKRLKSILVRAHEQHPQDFETLLGLPDVGPATIRSLSLLAEIIFQAPPSHRDPAKRRTAASEGGRENPREGTDPRRWADYSHAHGGKDGTPFPVDRDTYDRNIAVLTDAIHRAQLGQNDKLDALRRLSKLGGT